MESSIIVQRHLKDVEGDNLFPNILIRVYDDHIMLQQERDLVAIHKDKYKELIKILTDGKP